MTDEGRSTYELHCKSAFETLFAKIDRLDVAVRGNGKPGINTRLDRIEQTEKTRAKVVWMVVAAAIVQLIATFWPF